MSKAAWAGLLLLGAGLGLTTFFITAGIPNDVKASVDVLVLEVDSAKVFQRKAVEEFESIVSSETEFLAPLPEIKELSLRAGEITKKIAAFDTGAVQTAKMLVEENNRRKRFELSEIVDRARNELVRITQAREMDKVIYQANRLKSYKTEHKKLLAEATAALAMVPTATGLNVQLETQASKLKADYPAAAGKIDAKLSALKSLKEKIDQGRPKLEELASKRPVDYLATGRLVDLLTSQAKEYQARQRQVQGDLQTLAISEDRVLVDMKAEGGNYFHKYKIIRGTQSETTSWQKVTASFYRSHEDNLGMTLSSKPEGVFAEDATKVAAPPGYNYVGNTRYGQWQYRGSTSYWVFYGQYRFMQDLFWGPSYYSFVSRGDYNGYRSSLRRGRPYYGASRQYGSRGTTTKKRYSSSSYVRKVSRGKYRGSRYNGSSGRSGGYRGSRYRGSSFGGSGK
ncbi:MAG: hypothetical protein VYA30_03775 [Myxococcota bacterium]|nr:hypothetical protein [Myxococcota bacterium]